MFVIKFMLMSKYKLGKKAYTFLYTILFLRKSYVIINMKLLKLIKTKKKIDFTFVPKIFREMRHPIYGMRNAAWVGLHAAWIAATPPRGIKHSICILLFNISLCYPQPSARGRHVTHCCHESWCTRAAAMCLLFVGADLSPFTNDRICNYNFNKSKRIVCYNELLYVNMLVRRRKGFFNLK